MEFPLPAEFIPEDVDEVFPRHTICQDNLPDFMSKIETGNLSYDSEGNPIYQLTLHRKPRYLRDASGNHILSPSTAKPIRDLPFLPANIDPDVPGWQLWCWQRLAAERGIKLVLEDIFSRSRSLYEPMAKEERMRQTRALSNRMQRYASNIGILQPTEKSKSALACPQNLETIANLTVLQGKLNTWWLPNHPGAKGPWRVYQPKWHPEYERTKGQAKQSAFCGKCYAIENATGLSVRVRRIADCMVWLDCLAIERGTEPSKATRATLLTEIDPETERLALGQADFLHWLDATKEGPSIAEVQQALDAASGMGESEIYAELLGGDFASLRPGASQEFDDDTWKSLIDFDFEGGFDLCNS